jgi:preprotein translocase subunit SecF
MHIIKNKFVFIGVSITLVVLSLASLAVFGLRYGIDFKGGTALEVEYTATRPEAAVLTKVLADNGLAEAVVQTKGENGLLIKSHPLTDGERLALVEDLAVSGKNPLVQKSFSSIGPAVGRELSQKTLVAIVLVFIAIIAYIAFAFRGVSKPVASWKYGVVAIVSLLHDIIIPTGLFALLGYLTGAEVDTLFVVALLTVLGVSVSDTIVVFDRIRENLKMKDGSSFAQTVGKSLSQTITRSVNTSVTTILVLASLYIFGPAATKNFALVLIVGMVVGTYSSIFLASPLLVIISGKGKSE